jgi:hypothetical protein
VLSLIRTRGCGCIAHPAFPAPSDFRANFFAEARAHLHRENAFRRHSGARRFLGASPESIRPMVVMDSGPAPSGASRNDGENL